MNSMEKLPPKLTYFEHKAQADIANLEHERAIQEINKRIANCSNLQGLPEEAKFLKKLRKLYN